jgi:polysaccharide chain length determinant protein (PEP-CTERM system associated)
MQQQPRELGFGDYVVIAQRRALWIIVPAVIVTTLAVVTSYVLPPRYTSRALVLIEQQKVPSDYVRPLVNQDPNGRLTVMTQTVLSRTRLQPIIERFGLYANQNITIDEKLEKLRKDIVVTPVRSELSETKGSPGFFIAVSAHHPRIAQQVCGEIASMFLSENLKSREQSAEGTTQFLRSQLEDAKRALDEQDANLAAFQKQYLGQLPGQEAANLNMLAALNSQLDAATQALSRMEQDKTYTEALLAQQTSAVQTAQGSGDAPPARRIETQIEQLQTQLSGLEARYTPDHPDVVKARRELESLKKRLASPAASTVSEREKSTAETPQVQELRAQLKALTGRIAAEKAEQDRIQQQIKTYQVRIQLSPVVQERYRQLTRDYETAQRFYNDLLVKKDQSAMSTDLERSQGGEAFRLVDPPNLPEKPTFPDRLLFAIGGLAGGLCVGGGLAAWVEYRDKTLRNEHDVLYFTKLETLAMIPVIASAMPDVSSRKLLQCRKKHLAEVAPGGRT